MSKHERKWLGAWGGSLLIHAGVVGIAALVGLVMSPTSGGGGLITVEIGGPGGMAGGLGDRQHEGRKGDGGANASGADASAPGESAETPPQSAAPKIETGEEGLAPNKTAAPPAEPAPAAEPQEPAPLPMASTETAPQETSDASTVGEPNPQPAAPSETEAPEEPKEDAAAPTNHEPLQEEKPAAAQEHLPQPEAVKEAVRSAADDSTQKKPKEIAAEKPAEKPLPESGRLLSGIHRSQRLERRLHLGQHLQFRSLASLLRYRHPAACDALFQRALRHRRYREHGRACRMFL